MSDKFWRWIPLSFGKSIVFPFPAVQYIPLNINQPYEGKLANQNLKTKTVKIFAGPEIITWQTIFNQDYGIEIPSHCPPNSFPILAINLKITEIKYRSFFVTMLGKEALGNYQYFTISADRFYKPKLFFKVYDQTTAQELANYSLFMPQCNYN